MTDRGGIWLKTLLRKITHMAAEPSRSTTFDTSIATMAGDNGGADATSVPPPMPNQGGYDYAVGATAAAPAMMLPPTPPTPDGDAASDASPLGAAVVDQAHALPQAPGLPASSSATGTQVYPMTPTKSETDATALAMIIKLQSTVMDLQKEIQELKKKKIESTDGTLMDLQKEIQEIKKKKIESTDGTLKDIDRKDIDRPGRYNGDASTWVQWSKKFKSFLSRRNRRWPELLDAIQKIGKGSPLTTKMEDGRMMLTRIKDDVGIDEGEEEIFKQQLHEYMENYMEGNARCIVLANGPLGSWEAWGQIADEGRSMRERHLHRERREVFHPKQVNFDVLIKSIAAWETALADYSAASGESMHPSTKMMCLEDICPDALQQHLIDKKSDMKISTYPDFKQEIADYMHNRTRHAKVPSKATGKINLIDYDADDANQEDYLDLDPDLLSHGELLALVKKKFNKRFPDRKAPQKTGNEAQKSENGAAPMNVDHSDKQCYRCGEYGHISRNCKNPDAKKQKGDGKGGGGGKGAPSWGPTRRQWGTWFPGPSQAQWNGWYPGKGSKGGGKGGGKDGGKGMFFTGHPHQLAPLQDFSQYLMTPGMAMMCTEKWPEPKVMKFEHVNTFHALECDCDDVVDDRVTLHLQDGEEFPEVREARTTQSTINNNKPKSKPTKQQQTKIQNPKPTPTNTKPPNTTHQQKTPTATINLGDYVDKAVRDKHAWTTVQGRHRKGSKTSKSIGGDGGHTSSKGEGALAISIKVNKNRSSNTKHISHRGGAGITSFIGAREHALRQRNPVRMKPFD